VGNWTESPTTRAPSPNTPHGGDNLYFDGSISNVNCDDLAFPASPGGGTGGSALADLDDSGDGSLNSLNMVNGYAGTVTYSLPLPTHDLILKSGTLNPKLGGTTVPDVTVDRTFTWQPDSSGQASLPTINNTAALANVFITGATATIDPLGTTTLPTGSTLNFLNGASATFLPGTVMFNNGAGIYVAAAQVQVKPTADATVTHNSNVSFETGVIDVEAGGVYTVTGTNNFAGPPALYDAKMPLVNNGGIVTIQGGATLSVRGYFEGDKPTVYSYTQNSGETYIENGSTLKTVLRSRNSGNDFGGVARILGGVFTTLHNGLLQPTQQKAVLDGQFRMEGATASLIIGYGGFGTANEVFEVTQSVAWNAGTYLPFVNASNNAASLWLSDSTFTVAQGVSIAPQPIGTPTSGQTWKIIQATNITGPTPQPSGWTVLAPNPAIEWDLRKN
jgi:hypothetical protein